MTGRKILLIVGGGIAAYKSLELVRRLQDAGLEVRCVMTAAAQRFVTPLSFAALTANRVFVELFDHDSEQANGHIALARDPDLVIVAPATADLMAKLANGHADDLASAILLATRRPVLLAPAMNPSMWENPAVRRNFETLRAQGVAFIGPGRGEMAEAGEAGEGRMAEPHEIVAAAGRRLGELSGPLQGRRIIVTSGPTHEPIDPVRYIANRSSGRQGHAIAAVLAARGAEVTLVSGPASIPDPPGVLTHHVETALEMQRQVEMLLPADVAIFVAAVADWRVEQVEAEKLKKAAGQPRRSLLLVENPDILAGIGHHAQRPRLVIGFAAETSNVVANARLKLDSKGADFIIANDVSSGSGIGEAGVMGGARNRVSVVSRERVEQWPEMEKPEVGERLADLVARHLAGGVDDSV